MENRKSCPIEEALLRIEASAKSSRDLVNTLYFLQRTVSNMLTQSNDWRTIIALEKENELFIQKLLLWDEAREFLNLIGFNDKDGTYQHSKCDEGIKFLEATLRAINARIYDLKIAFIEEKPCLEQEILKSNGSERLKNVTASSSSSDGHSDKGSFQTKEKCCTKLKEMLSRHLKQEQPERGDVSERKKREISAGSSFNAGGYFYQTCPKENNNKKRKCFLAQLFDKHDFNCKQKGPAFFSFLKLG